MSYVDFPIGIEEAKEERLRLMAERAVIDHGVNDEYEKVEGLDVWSFVC